ncbi:hypothetical protein JW898_01920 [Candidatus Woesearchaeota archaeon]|nr:hypothetical protein [Candidatus Woesearchaeota archaeon]
MQKKIKPLLPSLRERKRYLAFEIISEQPLEDFNAVSKAIIDKALEQLGVLGCAEAGIMILPDKYNKEKQRGLMRVSNRSLDKVRGTLALIDQIDSHRVIVRSRGVSGILNKAESRYIAG